MSTLLARLLLIALLILNSAGFSAAADYQQCTPSESCTIGEFLYDDEYAALTGATCTLTAKYPDNTSFVSGVAMTGGSDGWYSYDASIDTTEGIYHTNMCCDASGEYLCIDKTFEVKSAAASGGGATAADIWSYSDRTLTGYGSLVSDIWGYSTRSLTSFGSLVSDIWGYSTRTMTGFGTLVADILGSGASSTTAQASPVTLTTIVAEQNEQRELLEKLVNAPVISLSLDEGVSIPDLETKLDESKKQASLLYDLISSGKSRLMTLDSKWGRLSANAATGEITAVASLFQDQDALIALTKSWDTASVTTLNQESADLQVSLGTLLSAATLGKSLVAPGSLTESLEHISTMEAVLGDSTNGSSDKTIFGYLAQVEDRHASLSGEGQKLAALLENLNGQGVDHASRSVSDIKSRLLTLNVYPGGASLASPAKVSHDEKLNLKNILFSLQALVGLNKQILAMNVGDPIRSLWLEEGSIIFRAVITNPSTVISQSVPLKFYLPRELKTEDIITLDPSLTTTYDSSEEALYASGTYNLKAGETKLVYVEVEDIWQLTDSELQTLRTQASDLLKPLEKTAYFSQGTTLKSDIDVTLDKVLASTSKAVTPENRIRTYREAKLELAKVTANMNRLQDLVAQASGTGSLFGFVGGVQTVAVWGIILVVVTGFAFLALYFKKLGLTPTKTPTEPIVENETESSADTLPVTHLTPLTLPPARPVWQLPVIIMLVMIATAGSTLLLTRLAKPTAVAPVNQISTSPSPIASASPTPAPSVRNDINVKDEKSVLGETDGQTTHTLAVPEDSSVNVRNKPSANADIIMAIKESQDVYMFEESGDWIQIGFTEADELKDYWVNAAFIIEK